MTKETKLPTKEADMIPPDDLKVTCAKHPPGGQHVGTPPPIITVEHLPTGLIATVGSDMSQHRNRTIAIEMIEAALTSPNFRY